MYEIFDSYLGRDTWHVGHAGDDGAFFSALSEAMKNQDFNSDEMGEYMRARKNVAYEDRESGFALAIQNRVSDAWAITGFSKWSA